EWSHEERNTMHPVLPGLLVGPYIATRNVELLQRYHVTHILCIRDPLEVRILNRPVVGIENQFMDVPANVAKENIIQHFDQATLYIEQVIGAGGHVLVCCADGIDKGPAFAAAYLMRKYALRAVDSITFMQNRRYCSCPSARGYRIKLLEYEPICDARRQFEGNANVQGGSGRRRAAEDDIGD
ncbi:phosphatases II, partial [Linderina pennispora]